MIAQIGVACSASSTHDRLLVDTGYRPLLTTLAIAITVPVSWHVGGAQPATMLAFFDEVEGDELLQLLSPSGPEDVRELLKITR